MAISTALDIKKNRWPQYHQKSSDKIRSQVSGNHISSLTRYANYCENLIKAAGIILVASRAYN